MSEITLHCGDCMDYLRDLSESVCVLTDPPWGVGYSYHGGGNRRWAAEKTEQIAGDDQPFDPSPFLEWPCIFWGADNFAESLPSGRWLVWDKRRGVCPPRSQSDCEMAWCSESGASRIYRYMWDGMVRDGEVGIRRQHPNQKPVELMKWCLSFLPEGCTVFDPFMGSGTTGVACVQVGRNFIGCEIDPGYFAIAERRLEEAKAARGLYVGIGVS